MGTSYKILIMGASYGSLLGTKLALAGHTVKLVCLPAEADLINTEGAIVRLPVKGREGLVEINSKKLPGQMSAGGTTAFKPADFDLVVLAMQEPQYRSPGVRELLDAVAKARVPCMSIMNMPPLPYLARIPGVDAGATVMMKNLIKKKGVASIEELREAAVESDVNLIACQMTMDLFEYKLEDMIPGIAVGGAATYMENALKADINLFI